MKPSRKAQKKHEVRASHHKAMVAADKNGGKGFTAPGSRNPKKQA